MVWQRIRDAFGGDDSPPTPTVADVFRTFAALAAEGVPLKTVIEQRSVHANYGWTNREVRNYGTNVHSMKSMRRSVINLGWIWFAGSITRDQQRHEYLFPAISVPVRSHQSNAGYVLDFTGDFQISPLLTDAASRVELARRLESDLSLGEPDSLLGFFGLKGPEKWVDPVAIEPWVSDFAEAMGLGEVELSMENPASPEQISKEGITFHPGFALFESRTSTRRKRVYDLTALDRLPSLDGTAFNALYDSEPTSAALERPDVASFRPLSLRQRSIAKKLTTSSLSVLSGAPGTGKTHLISVTAADAVARGESVLVLAGSAKVVDVLVEHFAETPGPPPITFGGSRFGGRISEELIEIAERIDTNPEVDQSLIAAAAEHDERVRRVRHELEVIRTTSDFLNDPDARGRMAAELAEVGDLDEVQELLDSAEDAHFVPWERRVANRLGTHVGAAERLRKLKAGHDALTRDENPLSLASLLDEVASNEIGAANVGGDLLTQRWITGLGRDDENVLRSIARALLTNRYERGQLLTELDPETVTTAAPLWVGSVDDVDDVLPTIVGLFDLVIIDEASQIDQVAAANALIRAKRALICGDPQQIGFEQYLSKAEVDRAKEACNTTALPLTPKELSLFDVAAAKFGVEVLDEHFRSAPHVIEFSSRRFYDGGLFTATRNLKNEAADHIDVSIVDGVRRINPEDGERRANGAEAGECMVVLESHLDRYWNSIGIVTPFEEHAETIEALVRRRFSSEEIAERDLRVGTVRDFQGDECDLMIVSYGVGSDEPDDAWELVNDPKFFNVMATRAREHVHIVSSNPKPPGFAGEYLRWEEPLVDLIKDEGSTDPWVNTVADVLRTADIPVRVGYRVGRYVIDIVAGDAEHCVAIDCTMHPDGADAHIDRALLLRRTGWSATDAFPEKWRYRIDLLVDELCEQFPGLHPEAS